ncbi:MAG: glycosyl hydrolase family 18 protein [Patescibacteria group bacterium]
MKNKLIIVGSLILGSFIFPNFSLAASNTPLTYGAWLPFWKKAEGAMELSLRLPKFTAISPFSYEVNADGTLIDKMKMESGFWPDWLNVVRAIKVKIVPSVAWLDGAAIHKLLSNTTRRRQHASNIANLAKTKNYDGIDIDYEDKDAETEPYFSLFIEGLSYKLHAFGKKLSCTIEGRTPRASQFRVIPKDLAYANNYAKINEFCDEVKIMAYDQGRIDLDLNAKKGSSNLYMPVADPEWVEKVITQTIPTISPKKVILGIPTYGYIFEISWKDGVTTYKRVGATTYPKAIELAQKVGATSTRNSAGELSFVYATSTSYTVSANLTFSISSTQPTALATQTNPAAVMRLVSFSDASSMMDKINLAKKYKLKGVYFFKADGDIDPTFWDEFNNNEKN